MPDVDLKTRALRLLARREHSRTELQRKLSAHTEDAGEIDALLDDLQNGGWLSDARYAEQLIQARRGKYGSLRVVHELREKGVAEEMIAEALSGLKAGELENARAVWAKKFGKLPADAQERAKQMRFLASRGFSQEVIWKLLRQQDEQDF